MSKPITHGPVSKIPFKLCKCSQCGVEATCSPEFDFYTKFKDPQGPLFCYPCLCASEGLKPYNFGTKEMN